MIRLDGNLYEVLDTQHVKPGKGGAYMQTDLRMLKSDRKLSKRFRASENLDVVEFDSFAKYDVLYVMGGEVYMMNPVNYDQVSVPSAFFGKEVKFLDVRVGGGGVGAGLTRGAQEGTRVSVAMIDGEPVQYAFPLTATAVVKVGGGRASVQACACARTPSRPPFPSRPSARGRGRRRGRRWVRGQGHRLGARRRRGRGRHSHLGAQVDTHAHALTRARARVVACWCVMWGGVVTGDT